MVLLTVLNDLIANKLAIIVEKPGARQLWAMKPSLSSAKQMTSSPRFQSQLGIFNKYACDTLKKKISNNEIIQNKMMQLKQALWINYTPPCYDTALAGWSPEYHRNSSLSKWHAWCSPHLRHQDPGNICWPTPSKHLLREPNKIVFLLLGRQQISSRKHIISLG